MVHDVPHSPYTAYNYFRRLVMTLASVSAGILPISSRMLAFKSSIGFSGGWHIYGFSNITINKNHIMETNRENGLATLNRPLLKWGPPENVIDFVIDVFDVWAVTPSIETIIISSFVQFFNLWEKILQHMHTPVRDLHTCLHTLPRCSQVIWWASSSSPCRTPSLPERSDPSSHVTIDFQSRIGPLGATLKEIRTTRWVARTDWRFQSIAFNDKRTRLSSHYCNSW